MTGNQWLLAILKRGASDKAVEKCELSIVDPEVEGMGEEEDSLESKLVVRMYCKHGGFFLCPADRRHVFMFFSSGVVKTHKLPLHTIESAHQFTDHAGEDESYVTIGPKMLKDIIEHFPSVRGNKGDPQLVWGFGDSEVIIRSMETSLDTRGKLRQLEPTESPSYPSLLAIGTAQLATELVLSPEEFDKYNIASVPTSIAFQLKEFTVSVVRVHPTHRSH